MNYFLRLTAIFCSIMFLCGCTSKEASNKPTSRGLPYELALIVPQSLYSGELKDSLDAVLKGSTPVLPQHEPLFRLDVVYAEGNLTPWRTFRNRLIVEIDTDAHGGDLGIARDVVARPQIEVRVSAASAHELAIFLGEHRQRLIDIFVDSELDGEAARLRHKYSKSTADSLSRLTAGAHTICVPDRLRSSKMGEDFLWTGSNLNDKDQNFVFYSYPWDGQPMTAAQFVAKRDSVLKVNIPGSQPNQWMQTAYGPGDQPLIVSRARTLINKDVLEVHGLWELHNGALGGPFVSLSHIDTVGGRVIVTEGFIYSPHSPKRNLMRQMEAALRTFK